MSKSALEVLQASGVPESIYGKLDSKQLNQMARALDSTFRVPTTDAVKAEVVQYIPKGNGKPGMFVSVSSGGRNGIFHRVCDGKELSAEGKEEARALLTALGNACADALETL